MNVIGIQLDIVWENKPENFSRVDRLMAAASPEPGSLIVLPEMFATGFSMDAAKNQESLPSPTVRFLSQLAQKHQVGILAGMVLKDAQGRPRNESVFLSPAGVMECRYAKMQPFTLAGEAQNFAAGTQVEVFSYGGFRIAPFVCYDLRFPELFRAAIDQGADLLVVIANWPVVRVGHWRTLLQARAIENQAYVVGVNRTGSDPTLHYTGQSLIVDPLGEILAEAGEPEGVMKAQLDPHLSASWRAKFPALTDRRMPPGASTAAVLATHLQ